MLCLYIPIINSNYAQGNTCGTATNLIINGPCDSGTISDGNENTPFISGCNPSNFRREGWYSFTVTAGHLNVTITTDAADKGLYLQLIRPTASCTNLSEVACANNTGTNNSAQTETITATLNNGIYYIKVVNEENNGDMILNSICVTAPISAPQMTTVLEQSL